MNLKLAFFASLALTGCNRPAQRPDTWRSGTIELAPASAAQDIRNTFRIDGRNVVSIDQIRHVGQQRGLSVEDRRSERALLCDLNARRDSLRFLLLLSELDSRTRIARRYIVVYRQDGRVLCIEARHEHADSS